MRKQLAAVLIAPVLAISSAQTAEAVRWDDLPQKIGKGDGRDYTIVTKDGNARKGIALVFRSKGILLNGSAPEIPRDDIAEVRIHHHLAFREASGRPLDKMMSGSEVVWFLTPLIFLILPIYGVTAPPAVAIEGIRRALPDKVIKVAP